MAETKSLRSNTVNISLDEVGGERVILYTLVNDGITDILSYDENLFNILQLDALQPFRNEGRIEFGFSNRLYSGGEKFYIYDLALGCYQGRIREETFVEDLFGQREYKNRFKLSVDHADSNQRNNTRFNLSLMPDACNNTKRDITRRVRLPAKLLTCYFDGEYRIMFQGFGDGSQRFFDDISSILEQAGLCKNLERQPVVSTIMCICKTPCDYVDQLNRFVDSCMLYSDGSVIENPLRIRHGWVTKMDQPGAYDDPFDSILSQVELALWDRSEFDIVRSA